MCPAEPSRKPDTPAGRLASGRNYQPSGSTESVPTLGTWPLLYELGRDPGEAYNLAQTHPETARELGEKLEAWRAAFHANPRGWK